MPKIAIEIEKYGIKFEREIPNQLAMKIYRMLQPKKSEIAKLKEEQKQPETKTQTE